MSIASRKGRGWLKDLPDFRDNSPLSTDLSKRQKMRGALEPVNAILSRVNAGKRSGPPASPSTREDLRAWCSPVEDQGSLGSCSAHAGISLFEYFEKRAFGRYVNGSRLFLYKATRNLLRWEGDDGAYLRSTMGALALFGVVPEKYWPYDEKRYNDEPSAFLYSYARNFQAVLYYRLDNTGIDRNELLERIKEHLRNALPCIFGFSCYSSLDLADDGNIPFPDKDESADGGHAVMAVGFDDDKKIINPGNKRISTTGAFLIKNSWGTEWGENGYGWLPYEYVLQDIAEDWWCMTKAEWIDTRQFGF